MSRKRSNPKKGRASTQVNDPKAAYAKSSIHIFNSLEEQEEFEIKENGFPHTGRAYVQS